MTIHAQFSSSSREKLLQSARVSAAVAAQLFEIADTFDSLVAEKDKRIHELEKEVERLHGALLLQAVES